MYRMIIYKISFSEPSLITESTLAEILESTRLFSLNGSCFYYFFSCSTSSYFLEFSPRSHFVIGWNRVNSLLRQQFHTADIESGNNELPKGSETLGLFG